ncbi:heme-binding protein [Halorussus gelatinilyticus]|uniref:Heme-binding protein n=1 Tax=Halorussus gelatinilyticus TaxID=2937524 RepID=A0A8U0ILK7_9EURY|nr:heme-binding protein [Halorussus gelatinilyticus]UPW02023.1 heme-binding protein [Halorussus gelatinilyticus]
MRTRIETLLTASSFPSSRRSLALLAGAGGLLAAWVGWGAYVDRTTERVPYETVTEFDGVELRRYPRLVLAETTAENEDEAFERLFRYISGENETGDEVAMTAPVATRGTTLPMTTPVRTDRPDRERISTTGPVRTDRDESEVTMAFYLPADYDPGDAPIPTNAGVRLAVEPPRTLAVIQFSWYAGEDRVRTYREALLDALDARDIEPRTRPALLQYDDPWTPPFMRRNEVAVEVDHEAVRIAD